MSEDQDQVARELADELRKLKVEEILIGTLIQVSQIGYRRLGLTQETPPTATSSRRSSRSRR